MLEIKLADRSRILAAVLRGGGTSKRWAFVIKGFCCVVKIHVHCGVCDKSFTQWDWMFCCMFCYRKRPSYYENNVEHELHRHNWK